MREATADRLIPSLRAPLTTNSACRLDSPPSAAEVRCALTKRPVPESKDRDVTTLLRAVAVGDLAAGDRLMALVYHELRALAARQMRSERNEHTLSPTALVGEAWLRLAGPGASWDSRAHFYGAAARAMRRILVDHARARSAAKRDRRLEQPLEPDLAVAAPRDDGELLAVHEALERLAALDPRQAQVVELRYFAGLSIPDTALALDISPATVKREWTLARAWLHRELGPDAAR